MTFSDGELKSLKADLYRDHRGYNIKSFNMYCVSLEALLHRLDCAENVLLVLPEYVKRTSRYKAWLRSKGQGGQGE